MGIGKTLDRVFGERFSVTDGLLKRKGRPEAASRGGGSTQPQMKKPRHTNSITTYVIAASTISQTATPIKIIFVRFDMSAVPSTIAADDNGQGHE